MALGACGATDMAEKRAKKGQILTEDVRLISPTFAEEGSGHAKSPKDVHSRIEARSDVRLAQISGKPLAQLARERGMSDTSIQKLRKELAEHDSSLGSVSPVIYEPLMCSP